jgi:curved DNA-binding protein CbpA
MDIQKALKLLDLKPGATLEDARAAFKKKAKLFHPDKLMAASKNKDDGEKMKDINVAYHTLKMVLKPGSRAKVSRTLSERLPPACRRLVDTVGKWIFDRIVSSAPAAPPRTPSQQQHPSGTQQHPHKTFEDVLRQSLHRRAVNEKKYSAYARYLELERKMKQARQYASGTARDVDSVEPVSRIKPVK